MTRSRHGETGFLARPPAHLDAESVDAVVALKFRLGALLKAERVLVDWSRTETNWAHAGQAHRIGPYTLHSDYQRANLTVAGPHFVFRSLAGSDRHHPAHGVYEVGIAKRAVRGRPIALAPQPQITSSKAAEDGGPSRLSALTLKSEKDLLDCVAHRCACDAFTGGAELLERAHCRA